MIFSRKDIFDRLACRLEQSPSWRQPVADPGFWSRDSVQFPNVGVTRHADVETIVCWRLGLYR